MTPTIHSTSMAELLISYPKSFQESQSCIYKQEFILSFCIKTVCRNRCVQGKKGLSWKINTDMLTVGISGEEEQEVKAVKVCPSSLVVFI